MDNEELLRIIDDAAKKNLTTLYLSDNELTQLPPEIGLLKNIKKLHLCKTQLTQLPAEIGKLTNLTELHLSLNQLEQLPAEIDKLTNLTVLNLSYNKLTQLPSEVAKFTNLEELYLQKNQLTQLSSEICKLTNLTLLDLSLNKLEKLPPEIGKLANLTLLGLSSNQLEQLPLEMAQLKLDRLYLSYNKFNIPQLDEQNDPRDIINKVLFANYRKGKIVDDELVISIGTQRQLKEDELVKITEWLSLFKIKAFFGIDQDAHDIKLSRKNKDAIHEIKQYISNKYQDYRKGQVIDGELVVSIVTQRNLKKDELTKITEWLNTFKIRARFAIDNNSNIKLSENSENAIHEIKRYISNKYQDHISQVYDQKTQDKT